MKKLTLGTLLAALAASAMLAAPGGAAKPIYSISCTSSSLTLTWPSGTTGADWTVNTGANGTGNELAAGHSTISPHGHGMTTIILDTTNGTAGSATVTFTNNKNRSAPPVHQLHGVAIR